MADIDSGFNVLASRYNQVHRFVSVASTRTIRKNLGITGLDELIPVVPSIDEALTVLVDKA